MHCGIRVHKPVQRAGSFWRLSVAVQAPIAVALGLHCRAFGSDCFFHVFSLLR